VGFFAIPASGIWIVVASVVMLRGAADGAATPSQQQSVG
jgi:hypothetical protein